MPTLLGGTTAVSSVRPRCIPSPGGKRERLPYTSANDTADRGVGRAFLPASPGGTTAVSSVIRWTGQRPSLHICRLLALLIPAFLPSNLHGEATDAEYAALIQAFQTVRNSTGWPVQNQTYTNIQNNVYDATTFDDVESSFNPRI